MEMCQKVIFRDGCSAKVYFWSEFSNSLYLDCERNMILLGGVDITYRNIQ